MSVESLEGARHRRRGWANCACRGAAERTLKLSRLRHDDCAIIAVRFMAIAECARAHPAVRKRDGAISYRGRLMDGIHLLGEWYGCPADTPEFTRADALRALCVKAGTRRGSHGRRRALSPVRAAGRHRHGAARRIAPRDPYVARARLRHRRRLRLQPRDRQHGEGGTAVPHAGGGAEAASATNSSRSIAEARMPPEPEDKPRDASAGDIAPGAMTEHLTDDWGFFVRSSRAVRALPLAVPDGRSARHRALRQAVPARRPFHDVGEGRVLLSRESRPPGGDDASAARSARSIIGGGDGGSAEELLKHPSIKSVTLCEIDLAVVDIARKYLQRVHRGALDDPRLTLKIDDGFEFVRDVDRDRTTSSCSI